MYRKNRIYRMGGLVVGTGVTSNALSVDFLTTDGATLIRANSEGFIGESTTLNAAVQSLTILPTGVNLLGAVAGDIIASARNAISGRWSIFRLNDPFGASSLTQIGSTNKGIGSLTFAGGRMYGVDDSLSALRIYELDLVSGNAIATYNTGIAATGGGGLAFDAGSGLFYVTDAGNNRLYSWTPSGGASLVGSIGFGFSNNGIEFFEGVLYGGLRQDTGAGNLRMGSFNTGTGAFTTMATMGGITGGGTGFVVVPEPTTSLAFGFGAMLWGRRRKQPL